MCLWKIGKYAKGNAEKGEKSEVIAHGRDLDC